MRVKTSKGLLDWFERKGIKPTMDSEKDMKTFKRQVRFKSYNEHRVRK